MDAPEPDTPFAAVSAQTSKYQRVRSAFAAHHFQSCPLGAELEMRATCRRYGRIARLMEDRYTKPTSTSQHPSPPTDGQAPARSSSSSACAYSGRRDGISVCIPPSPLRKTRFPSQPLLHMHKANTQHSRILPRHLPPKPLPRLPVPKIRPLPRTR